MGCNAASEREEQEGRPSGFACPDPRLHVTCEVPEVACQPLSPPQRRVEVIDG